MEAVQLNYYCTTTLVKLRKGKSKHCALTYDQRRYLILRIFLGNIFSQNKLF